MRIVNEVTRFSRAVETDGEGSFTVANIPFFTYQVIFEGSGFRTRAESVPIRASAPVRLDVTLELADVQQSVTVVESDSATLVDPEKTGSYVQMNEAQIDKMALQAGNRGLEAVLQTMPGFMQNANGAIHPRGAHNQMTYVIDGMPISDQLTGAFANAVDPSIVQTLELFTGNIPAEYGNKIAGVASVTTKSGLGTGRAFGGSVTAAAAQFDTFSQTTQLYGEKGRVGYSGLFTSMKSNRYLDQVSLDNMHNGGNSERAFARLDWQATQRDNLRLNALFGNSPFQLANLRSQQENRMQQRMLLRDWSAAVNWLRTLGPSTTLDVNGSYRAAGAQLYPSAGDTPVTASQARRTTSVNVNSRLSHLRGRQNIRAGMDVLTFPVRENFSFGITDPFFNAPASPNYIESLTPYDLTRGGMPFVFSQKRTGGLYSAFFQDSIKAGNFNISLGLRYDVYRFLVQGNQVQPRLGVSYQIKQTNTVLRASYNRTYQPPPYENLLLSNSQESAALAPPEVRQTLGTAVVSIRPERQNFYEAGLQQGLGRRMSLTASYYHKQGRDQQDNNNFFNTGVIFPITLASIRVNGVEGRWSFAPMGGFSGSVSVTHARAISTAPFTGGLYLGNDAIVALTAGPFVIDHDQPLAVQAILNYTSNKGWFSTLSNRYDSGLVSNPSDPAEVAADPDYRDLLPYVNLSGNPPRVLPRNMIDLVVGYERRRNEKSLWELSMQVTNLTGAVALYNFQSAFVGTRVVQPRTFGARLRWYF